MVTIRENCTLEGHTDRAWHVAWSQAAPILASCSSDKSIRMYSFSPAPASTDASSESTPASSSRYRFGLQSTIPSSHTRTVRSLSFSPTGATLSTASFDSTVGIWQQVVEAGLDDGNGAGDTSMAGGVDAQWDAVDPLEGHESECKSVEWSADGRLLASCSRDKSVWVWEAVGPAEFECLAVLMEHTQDVKAVTWHPSEELLASASYDDTVKLFAADPYDDEWSCVETLTGHTATVWSISFSPCGNYLASAGDDLVIKIWGRERKGSSKGLGELGEAVRQEGGRMGPWSSGGVRIGVKERWNWSLRSEIKDAHSRTIYAVDWAAGGTPSSQGGLGRLVTCGGDGKINVYQMTASSASAPEATLLATVEDAHGVSDVNHVAWCTLSPAKAAETLRRLEGGENEDEDEDMEERDQDGETAQSRPVEEDPRWRGARDMFASAGDDGSVKVWTLSSA